jgi:hypothetical protein
MADWIIATCFFVGLAVSHFSMFKTGYHQRGIEFWELKVAEADDKIARLKAEPPYLTVNLSTPDSGRSWRASLPVLDAAGSGDSPGEAIDAAMENYERTKSQSS